MRRFYEHMRELLKRSLRAGYSVNLVLNTMFLTFALGNAIALAVGAYLFGIKEITIGTVYLVFQYISMLQRPIEELARQMQELQRASAGITRIQEILGIQSRVQEPAQAKARIAAERGDAAEPGRALEVEFQEVSFAYPDRSKDEAGDGYALRGISFHLKPEATLGLLGRTGSGKTSLTRLLFRLYDPSEGCIRLGPAGTLTDLRALPVNDVRSNLGMVTQNIQLFNASVRDNLTFFSETVQDELITNTLRDLGLGAWLESLPNGLDTELESGGAGLSAGQAQLLAFARIFLHDPGLVILDEASSRLDPATEALIERAVDRLVQGRTAIIIAHRLHTVSRVDEILILEGGQVLEAGPRQELVANPESRFAQLLQTGLEDVLV
jgi:ATP-binding cassette subfamily B protein